MLKFPKYKYVLLALDLAASVLSFYTSSVLNREFISLKFIYLILFSAVLIFIFQENGLYKINVFSTRAPQFKQLLKSILISLLLYGLFELLLGFRLIYKDSLIFARFAITVVIIFTFYRIILLPLLLKYLINLKPIKRKCVVVCNGKHKEEVLSSIMNKPELGLEISGFIYNNVPFEAKAKNSYNVLGDLDSIVEVCKKSNIDEIIIIGNDMSYEKLIEIINRTQKTNCTTRLIFSSSEIISSKIIAESYAGIPMITLSDGMYGKIYLIQKRIFDLMFSFVALIFLAPLFAFIAILIKLTSKGPVFYRQERIGKGGKKFKMYKFRTMYVGSDQDPNRIKLMKEFIEKGVHPEEGAKSKKIVARDKITPIGRILRKFSIDELPQLINVLKGEMSLVGPRPVLPYEYEMFKPWHHERDKVLPGCTGFWQVYGRSKTNFDEMVLMDIYYIQNMSPWLDFWLILKTIPVMIFTKGGE